MEWLAVTAGLVAVFVVALWIYLTRNRGYIETLGIPVDPPYLVFGSEPRHAHKTDYHFYSRKFKKFGTKTYGLYEGITPTIVTIDPELVKSVCSKNFDCFPAVVDVPIPEEASTLDVIWGEKWRSLRKSLSPIFSSGKLKGMMEPMSDEVDKYIEVLERECKKGKPMVIKNHLEGMSLNIIGKCALGMDLDALNNRNHPIREAAEELLGQSLLSSWSDSALFQFFFSYFPELQHVINMWPSGYKTIWKVSNDIIEARESSGIMTKDFLSRLLELKKAIAAEPNAENHRGVTPGILTAQGSVFILAGYLTTVLTLEMVYYALAKNQEVQERAHAEVADVLERSGGKINHESVEGMSYTEAVINEALRMYAPVTNFVRKCMKDCEIAPGLLVKKGMQVLFPTSACHYCEDFYPEPERFNPERFLKENAKNFDPANFRPFGAGQRMCIGSRFAMTEMKIATAKTLQHFKILDSPSTKLNLRPWCSIVFAHDDILIELERR